MEDTVTYGQTIEAQRLSTLVIYLKRCLASSGLAYRFDSCKCGEVTLWVSYPDGRLERIGQEFLEYYAREIGADMGPDWAWNLED